MAQNDALTFYVRFMEDQNNTINNLVEKLANQLRSMVVHLDSRNIDVSGLKTELGKLEGAKVVDQESLTKAKSSIKEIAELLDKAFFNGGTKGGDKFPGLLQSLKDINTAIDKVVNKMGEMHTAISSIGSGMSTNVGNAIVNNMTQIVEATGRAISKVQELNELAGKNLGGKRAHKEEEKIIPPTLGLSSTNFKSEAEQIMKTYEEVEKRMQQKIKSIQDTIAKFPKDTFIKNPVNREWMKQEMDDVERLQRHLLSLLGVIEKFSTVQTPNRIIKFDEPVKQMTAEERNARQWMYNSLFNSREAIAMQNSVDFSGMEKARIKAAEIREQMDRINEAIARTNDQNLIQGATAAHQRLEKIHSELENISKTGGSSGGKSYAEYSKGTDIKEAVSQGDKVVKDINTAIEKARKAADEAKGKQIKANKDAADAELQRLKKIMRDLNSIQAKSPKLQIEGMDKAKQELQTLIELLQRAKKEGTSISGIDFGKFGYSNASETIAGLSRNQQTAALTAEQNAQAQQRMEQAIANATSKAQQQSQVLSDLRSMAAQYLSVWGATSFIKEIAQVTGELELQKKSLGVILDSASQAQDMFNQVKTLSQMSPYTFQDMLKSTRQLAAFGVETKNLYGTMKSLSDLGAGLDVDVQRLILAYGHVKSAGVLSGIQRRQFETAGINITGEIAKLYNERFKQAGSDERVSNADIFKKITKREIGFEDVEQAISRMTAPGGRFYNMQLRQFETLGGKLRNLRNNYNIMLDEIGKSYNGIFSGGVDSMNSMMENWRTWEKLIKSVTIALVAAKVASMALGKSWTAMRAAQNTMRQMRYEAQALGTTMSPVQTAAMSTTYAQSIVSNKDLNKFQKLRAILRPSVSADDRYLAASMITGNEKYAEQVRGMNKWQLATQRLKLGFQSFFSTLKAGFMAIATNPLVWLTAAVAAVTALTSKARELEQMRENATRNAVNLAGTDIRNLDKDFASLAGELGNKTDDGGWKLDRQKLDAYGVDNAFQQLDEMLQKYDPLYKGHIFDAKMIEDDYERVLKMFDDLEAARAGKKAWKESAAGVYQANTESGYGEDAAWWNLGLKGNWGQWDTAIDEAKEAQAELLKLRGKAIAHQQEIYDILFNGGDYDKAINLEGAKATISTMMQRYHLDFEEALEKYINNGGTLTIETPDFEIDTSKFSDKVDSFEVKAKGMFSVMSTKLKNMAKSGKTKEDMAAFVNETINGMLNVEGKELTDPAIAETLGKIAIENLKPPEGASEELAASYREAINGAFDALAQNMASSKMNDIIQKGMQKGDLFVGMDSKQFSDKVKPQVELAIAEIEATVKDPNLRKRLIDALNSTFRDISVNPRPAMEKYNQAWKRLYTDITDPNDPRKWITTHIGVDINAYTDETSFWIDINKKIAEIKKKVAAMKAVLPVTLTAKLNVDAIVDTRSAARAVLQAYDNLMAAYNRGDYKGVLGLKDVLDALYDIYKGFKAAGMTGHRIHDDSNKGNKGGGGHKSDSGKSKGGKGGKSKGGSGKDPEEEQWQADLKKIRDFINTAKDANKLYKDYRKEMDRASALRKLIADYKEWELIGPGKLLTEEDLKDIENFANITKKADAEIKKLEPRADKKGKPKRKEELEELRRQAAKTDSDIEMTVFREGQDKILNDVNSQLETLTRQWDRFNSVLQKTGDINIAKTLAGFSNYEKGMETELEALEEYINRYVAQFMQGAPLEELGLDKLREVDFSKVVTLDNDGIEEYVKSVFGHLGEDGSMEMIQRVKAVTEMLKTYKKAYEAADKKAAEASADAISKFKDYESELMRINTHLMEQNRLIDENTELTEAQRDAQKGLIVAHGITEALTKTPDYSRFMNTDTSMSMESMQTISGLLGNAYRMQLAQRDINAETFYKKMEEIFSKRREYLGEKTDELLDFSAKGRIERELKRLLGEFFDIAIKYEEASVRKQKAEEALDVATTKYNEVNKIFNENVEKEKEAKRLEKDGYKFSAKALREEIANSGVTLDDVQKAHKAVQKADMEVKNATIVVKDLGTKMTGKEREIGKKNDEGKRLDDFDKYLKKSIEGLQKLSKAISFVRDVLDSFGVESHVLEDALSVTNGAINGAQTGAEVGDFLSGLSPALGNAGPWGAAIGAALGVAGQLAQIHDKNLQRRIDEIKEDTTKMNNTLESIRSLRERQLGYDNGDLRRALAAQYGVQNSLPKSTSVEDILAWIALEKKSSGSADSAMREYYTRYSNGSGYEQELELLKGQREKIMEMYNLENQKKKKSKEELENYKQQIADLDEQIMFFTEDLANNLWGIDLKGWADQLSDALMTAFENGTSAASAFKDSVQDIMRDVVKNMLTVGVVEPALEKLRVRLFGKDGNGGVFKGSQENIGAVLSELGNWFENEGPALMDAANEFYNGADNMMRQILGYGMRESEKSTNAVSSITSTASEETMGIVAGYLSRLSQDVSVQRIMQEMFVNGSWPDYVAQVTSANDSLSAIDRSTAAMMEMMRDGNGALYERVENMSRRLDNFANGIDTITMR